MTSIIGHRAFGVPLRARAVPAQPGAGGGSEGGGAPSEGTLQMGPLMSLSEKARARAPIRAHPLRWRPRPGAQRTGSTPRAWLSGAALRLDPSCHSGFVAEKAG